jgi:S1-C subfamily serine protease
LAAREGIRVKDVIVKINNTVIEDRSQFWQVIRQHDLQEGIRLVVQRQGRKLFVFLQED